MLGMLEFEVEVSQQEIQLGWIESFLGAWFLPTSDFISLTPDSGWLLAGFSAQSFPALRLSTGRPLDCQSLRHPSAPGLPSANPWSLFLSPAPPSFISPLCSQSQMLSECIQSMRGYLHHRICPSTLQHTIYPT